MSDPVASFDLGKECVELYREATNFDQKLAVLTLIQKIGLFRPAVKPDDGKRRPDPAVLAAQTAINQAR